ncbi:MAG: prenyltransferase/squalene oxidase repeat-containing protein [Planctomycetota bacterium]|jgi:squalene-hopene/tetraprenyl-beta-curcumene cyclase
MRTVSHTALAWTAALSALGAAAASGQAPAPDPDGTTEEIYRQPQQPLDPRIDPQQVTEYDPPPLAQQVVLPVPPEFRIAAQADRVPVSADHFARARQAIDAGLAYLRSTQGSTGGWLTEVRIGPTDQPDQPSPIAVAVTALAVKAMIQADPPTVEDVRFQLALRFVRSGRRDDGAFEGGALTNYVTSMVVMALATIDRHDFHDELADASAWLEANQWDQTEGLSPRQDWFGGAGYGNRGRPDLSNTQTMLDALYEAGMSPDEPAVQRALSFVSRAQNLQATNKAVWAGNDGGFVYSPANGGESMASEAAGEGRSGREVAAGGPRSLRSYGSMTYAGFKSMLYSGLSPDDVRVRAAFDWVRRHWTFDENPGLGQQGLYYYYHTMARALRAAQQDVIEDIDGASHNWREELIDALVARKRDDGSWQNSADRWLEGRPEMATIFAVLALEEALKPVLAHE